MQKLAELCIRRPVFATMLITALVVLGLASYATLGVDLLPKIEFPTVTVTTILRGAAPEEIETQVTKRIEEAVNTISGIDELRSVSAEGVSQVFIVFLLEKNPDVAAQEVRDKVASVLNQLPKDADVPIIEKVATDAAPVINVVVSSKRELRETTKYVDEHIKKNIESLDGVGQVRIVGDRTRQIQVWLDGEKLYAYNLNIDQIRGALASQNVEIPGGRLDQGLRESSLRTLGRVERPEEFGRIIVSNSGGVPVRINDIGHIEDGVEEPRSLARMNGVPAVLLEVRKQAGTNTLAVIKTIKSRIAELRKQLPDDFTVIYTRDQSTFIEASFEAVQEHLILGGFCAAIVVLFFIRSWRSTLIAALAIPTSIISAFTLMQLMGFTLNQMTMLALTLIVGIVIDDAIVVLENIFRFAEEKGLPPMQAAVQGTKDISLAVLATTISLVIIFIPVAMMGGIVGKFMSSFGYTAAFAICVSLLVSFTLTPMLCSRFLKPASGDGKPKTKDTVFFRMLATPYRAMLQWSMRHRWAIVLVSVLISLSSIPLFQAIGKDFMPQDDQNEFEITARMPVGSSLEGTEAMMKQLETEIRQLPHVAYLCTTVGADSQRRVDRGSLLVGLTPQEDRKLSQADLMLAARDRLVKYRDLTFAIQVPSSIQGAGAIRDLQFFVQGPDLAQLDSYVGQIRNRLAQVPGVADLDSSYEAGRPEIRVKIKRDKASDLGVNVASIATALRTMVGGDQQVTTYRDGDDRYDVQLRVTKEFRDSPRALERLFVPASALGNVPLASVASFEESSGPTQIERYNRQRQILLTANIVRGQALSTVIDALNEAVDQLHMPPAYRSGLIGRSREFGRAMQSFAFAFLLSIGFMYMVLAAQFDSFIDPVTILLSLPLSVPFAIISLFLTGQNYSIIYSSLGILILFGIVKKNSILQIDHIKALRFQEQLPRMDAILHGCEDRLRPILMTTAALVAGMIPLALGSGAGAGSRRVVAIVVIGGQTLCLLLTLLITPVAYSLFDDLAHAPLWARLGSLPARGRLLFRRGRARLLLLALVLVGSPTVLGQQPQAALPAPPAKEARIRLEEAIEMALANNLDLEIQRIQKESVSLALTGARGFMDPIFRSVTLADFRNTPTSSVLQGSGGKAQDRIYTQNFSLRQRLPWAGSQAGVDFDNSRQSTTNPFTSLNPLYSSRLLFTYNQPLLRNRKLDRERTELKIRSKQVDLSETDLELRIIDVVTRVQQAYWDLVATLQDIQVQKESVELAGEQLARNRRMIAANLLAPMELAASEAELERRRDLYFASMERMSEVETILKALISPNRQFELWGAQIVPVEESRRMSAPSEADSEPQSAMASALQKRPELRAVEIRRQANIIQKQYNSDQLKPQLNFTANYYNSGIGGEERKGGNPFTASSALLSDRVNQLSQLSGLSVLPPSFGGPTPPFLIGGYWTALENVFSGRYQNLQLGLTFEMSVHNTTAESNLAQSLLAEKQLDSERNRIEQLIQGQIRTSLQSLQTAKQRITAAEASAKASQERLESETRLFQSGESTNFLVLTRQSEYSDARRRVVLANLDFNKSVTRFEQAVGRTLDSHGIKIK